FVVVRRFRVVVGLVVLVFLRGVLVVVVRRFRVVVGLVVVRGFFVLRGLLRRIELVVGCGAPLGNRLARRTFLRRQTRRAADRAVRAVGNGIRVRRATRREHQRGHTHVPHLGILHDAPSYSHRCKQPASG